MINVAQFQAKSLLKTYFTFKKYFFKRLEIVTELRREKKMKRQKQFNLKI